MPPAVHIGKILALLIPCGWVAHGAAAVAMPVQARLALLGIATSSLAAWANKGTVQVALPYAIAGAAQAVVVAYTLAKIMPVNHQLLPVGQVEKRGEATIRGLLKQWGHMHGRRTVLGGVAFGATLYGLHALLMRK